MSLDKVFVDLFNYKLAQINQIDENVRWQIDNTNKQLKSYGLKSFINPKSLKFNYDPSDQVGLTNAALFFKFLVFIYFTDFTIFSAACSSEPPKNHAIEVVNELFTKYNLPYSAKFCGPYCIRYFTNGQMLSF